MSNEIKLNDPDPLYLQIERALKNKIENGELNVGDQLGSQQELAKEYKVSLITIKKALTNLIDQGVLYSRVGKGTFVAEKTAVKKIKKINQKTIGLVLSDINHSYFSMIVHSIEERAYELGFNILLSNSSGSIEKEENQIDHFRDMGVDGLIIASLSGEYRATEYLQKLHKENFPYIMISYIHDPEYWYVGSDNELGGFIATEHLIKTGYDSIGYVHVGRGNLLSEVRKNGYYRALMEYQKPYSSEYVFYLESDQRDNASERFQLGKNFCNEFAHFVNRPQALLFFEDMVALGFIAESKENKITIPESVAIVGYDDVHISRYTSVPLTTIHQPIDTIGRLAVEIIQKRIEKVDIGNRTILKPTLIIRESCGANKRGMNPVQSITM
ncbi:MAG: GntR family transcriptional regulator [Bacteroidota bacterium]|nr:GntR family transcriptional regulator [Bacteroidota bacterium]